MKQDAACPWPNLMTQPHGRQRLVWSCFSKPRAVKEELGNSLGRKVFLTEEKLQSNAEESRCPGNTRIFASSGKRPCRRPCLLSAHTWIQTASRLLAFIFKALPPKTAFAENLPSASLPLCLCHPSLHSVCGAASFFLRSTGHRALLKVKVREWEIGRSKFRSGAGLCDLESAKGVKDVSRSPKAKLTLKKLTQGLIVPYRIFRTEESMLIMDGTNRIF